MKKIGIIGGSFDPIHKGHIEMIRALLEYYEVDQVWIVLAYQKEKAKGEATSATKRKKMINLALEEENLLKKVKINNYELDKKKFVQTYTTLRDLKKMNKNAEFFFAFGSDHVPSIKDWKNASKLKNFAKLICFPRQSSPIPVDSMGLLLELGCLIAPLDIVSISSTEVRHGIGLDKIDKSVLNYLIQNNTYIEKWAKSAIDDEKVFKHCVKVARKMKSLAPLHDIDKQKAFHAGLFHDIGKKWSQEELSNYLELEGIDAETIHPNVRHQYVAAAFVRNELHINCEDIYSAISKHTTADRNMYPLDKLLYVVDKMASTNFMSSLTPEEKDYLKQIVKTDLDKSFVLVLNKVAIHLSDVLGKEDRKTVNKVIKLKNYFLNKELQKK